MSSLSFHLLPTATPPFSSSNPSSSSLLFNPGVWFNGAKDKRLNFDFRIRCSAVSNARSQEYSEVLQKQNGLPLLKWHEIVEDDTQEEALKVSLWKEINKRVETIKKMLSSMEDGEISVSAYDTAWVALVEDLNGSGAPQFPSALQWIIDNQLADGSWGDNEIFEAHDRILNTLGCVIALKSWNVHPEKCEQGLAFFKNNLHKLEDEDPEHMPIGFEVAFPSLLEIARKLDIEIPDAPILKEIYDRRNLKLSRIPKDVLHKVPTTLLHSLEGMQNLDWNKLIKLQCEDGSFLFSPASTAYALQQTKDQKCLDYLNNAVQKHKGGVPNVYPVDLFENIWAIDRLNRLGISRYFEPEIKECVKHIHKYWRQDGICWARNSEVHDIDDTAMGFRILRLHGYDVSPDVFKFFEKNGEFCCFAGQSSQAVTGMFNLYRASQVLYPGEKIMEDARKYSSKFLREKRIRNELQDKWIITKDLTGEVEFALDVPWYAILPRVETRSFLEQYGGEDDVWIGKTLYRMPFVNNNEYLELGKLDYNTCQAIQRAEWDKFQKWYDECSLGSLGISKRSLLFSYFLAAASIFEPERSKERLAWAKTRILLETVHSCFNEDNSSRELRSAFVHDFKKATSTTTSGFNGNGRILDAKKKRQELLQLLLETLNGLSVDALVSNGRDISHDLRHAWESWLSNWETEGDRHRGEARLLVQTINLTAGRWVSEESHSDYPVYQKLADLTDRICHQLGHYQQHKVSDNGSQNTSSDSVTTPEIESNMQELVKLVYQNSSSDVKETFLTVAKSFYYTAFCDPGTINYHIARVLFERVY
ncbi:hypothetical protein K2173_018302 [Erythroxylum novogranatense]|uniref:Uncharacterized protein n=1 Tax=Erythroxylum novogranatense TaxID=1862640 RepID=A0AAV8UA77_9ROSI|nr:hypothetical protein K2173_018302 [Erythroxylum novogranatense]